VRSFPRRAIQFCAWTGVLCCFTAPAESALFALAAPTFSGFARCSDPVYVIEEPAVGGRISKGKLRDGRLYFSFRVIGSDDAVRYLNQNGSLEVAAVMWGRIQKIGEQSIGITPDNWQRNGAALLDEYRTTGIFNWRTCVYTQQLNSSSIQIPIRDAKGDFAAPVDFDGSYRATVTIDP
jgi:hypothetical protein